MSVKPREVHLGYALGSGEPVSIPVRHTVVTGITQEAGKTTTLEALISRSKLRGLAFVTKRGEGAFGGEDDPTIAPYFREETDWRFVASILEASLGEKLRLERSWIMRASKGAKTLADVQANVRRELAKPTTRGMNADMYYQLDQYLDEIVPQIASVRWAKRVELSDGLNVMDLTNLSEAMQHLVIRSSMLWILEREENTVVVIPEAWKFAPEQRGAPVKLVAESFIRQGAGLGNYLWIDSQDIAGVDKKLLKMCPVWILGVQRESNEIKRTLAQIPANTKRPKPEDIATLELGQFIACYGKVTIPTYVQPSWMNGAQARQVATGQLTIGTAVRLTPRPSAIAKYFREEETTVNEKEARELRDTNERLQARVTELEARLNLTNTRSADPLPARKAVEREVPVPAAFEGEEVYQAFKARLIDELATDARVMQIVLARPELRVKVERHVIEVDANSLRGQIARLIADGAFDGGPTTTGAVASELSKRGWGNAPPNIAREMGELTSMGFFTRDNKWFRLVPDMKVNVVEA